MSKSKKTETVELTETELDEAKGGIALLLPAVQKVREAPRSTSTSPDTVVLTTKTFKI
ncbi:MAG: hypothetical protein RIM84_17755 [Alphaproteobacteria bacterium]